MKDKLIQIWEKYFIAIIVCGISLTVLATAGLLCYVYAESKKSNDKLEVETNEKLDDIGFTEEEKEVMTEEVKDFFLYDQDLLEMNKVHLTSSATNATEYKNSEETLRQLYILYGNHDYDGIIDKVADILELYNLTEGRNTEIAALYQDAASMRHYDNQSHKGKESILLNRHHPVSLAVDGLYAYHQRRNAVMIDMASVSPVFLKEEKDFEVLGISVLDKSSDEFKKFEKIVNNKFQINNLYKIRLKTIIDELDCIILETPIAEYRIVGYYSEHPENHFTQADWNAENYDAEK